MSGDSYGALQVEEILNEVKFSHYVETGECKTDIDLPDFIRCNCHYSGYFLFYAVSKTTISGTFCVLKHHGIKCKKIIM